MGMGGVVWMVGREVAQRVNVKGVSSLKSCFRRIFASIPEAGALGERPVVPVRPHQSHADHAPLIDRWVRNANRLHFHMHHFVSINNHGIRWSNADMFVILQYFYTQHERGSPQPHLE
jgi:hypothetical protein